MVRHELWRRLLHHGGSHTACPFILSIGVGPRGTVGSPSFKSRLPVVSHNYGDLSDFEKDFVARCYSCLCCDNTSRPSLACSTAVHPVSAHRLVCEEPADSQLSWRPLLDLVVLPDGSVCLGWFRQHALDDVWIHHTASYVSDLWCRAPEALVALRDARMRHVTNLQLLHRHRHSAVFRHTAAISATEVEEEMQQTIRILRATVRHALPLEDYVLRLTGVPRTALMDVQKVMEQVNAETTELSTGTAAALIRMLLMAYCMYGTSRSGDLVEKVQAAAAQVCRRVNSSFSSSILLAWVATVMGGANARESKASTHVISKESHPALLATLHAVMVPSAAKRGAVLHAQASAHVIPLGEALLAEEAYLLDVAQPDMKPTNNARDVTAAKAAAAALAVPFMTRDVNEVVQRGDAAYLRRALGDSASEESGDEQLRTSQNSGAQPYFFPARSGWLPGTGSDVRGCWCDALTHASLLSAQLRLQPHVPGEVDSGACATAVEQTLHVLRVSLIRRCYFVTNEENMHTQYSLLTHLASLAVPPAVSVTLLHLSGPSDAREMVQSDAHDYRGLMGLLSLYPSLELRSFYGGSITNFRTTLASGTRAFRCYAEDPAVTSSDASSVHVDTVKVPARFVGSLTNHLQRDDAAVLCFVQNGLTIKDVFVLEDLGSHLRSILLE